MFLSFFLGCVAQGNVVESITAARCRRQAQCEGGVVAHEAEECVDLFMSIAGDAFQECLAVCEADISVVYQCRTGTSALSCEAIAAGEVAEACDSELIYKCPSGSVAAELELCGLCEPGGCEEP